MTRRRGQRGFTLVELMISLVMFSFAIAGVLSVAVTMTSGFREQRSTIGAESAARMAMDYLADAVRTVSPGVPSGNVQVAQAPCPAVAAPLAVINSAVGPDEMTLTFASGSVVTASKTAYAAGTTSLDVHDYSQFADGDTILIANQDQGILVRIAGAVTSSTLGLATQSCSTLTFPGTAGQLPAGSLVIRAMRARFYIADLDGSPALWMDPDADGVAAEPLAEGIEDMQLAYARDVNGDGAISEVGVAANDDEWSGNVAGDAPITTGAYRAVRITLIARTAAASGTARFTRPAAEDRAASTTPDRFRRRTLVSTIEIRNLQGSP